MLDIGCNAGYLTIAMAKELRPRLMFGIDLDGILISKARKVLNLRAQEICGGCVSVRRVVQSQKAQKVHSGDFSEGESDSDSQLLSFASYHYKGRSIYEDGVGGGVVDGVVDGVSGGGSSHMTNNDSPHTTHDNPSHTTHDNPSHTTHDNSSHMVETMLKRFPYNVYFKTENFLTEPHFFSQYDTITW